MDIRDLKNYEFAKDLMIRNFEETTMIYNPISGDMYELNNTGALLFEYLKRKMSGEDILVDICKEYDVTDEVVIEDVAPLLDRLIELNVLQIIEDT